jgi:3-hydroxy-9,10-secoandrosta-1,3,5(10)-triene-9,17-dione monooxygenase reductase component
MPGTTTDFDSAHFRAVLGHLPTGVTIVTSICDGRPIGFTVGTFTSISLDPPLVGFFAMTESDTWKAMKPTRAFCVNVLRNNQAELCWRFAKQGNEDSRFDGLAWTPSPTTGSPLLEGVAAWIDCTVERTLRLGDHDLVVGAVVALDHHTDTPVPLIFYRGALGGFASGD